MSKNLKTPSLLLDSTLESTFKAVVERSGGTVNAIVSEKGVIQLSAKFGDRKYYIDLKLVWSDGQYIVENFMSNESVEEVGVGKNVHLQAFQALSYEIAEGVWKIRTARNLLSLLEAHTRWSEVLGLTPVFKFK